MNPVLELVNRLRASKNTDGYMFYYWDERAKQKFGFAFSEIKLVDGAHIVLQKKDGQVSIPTHRIMEVKKGQEYIIKRDVKDA